MLDLEKKQFYEFCQESCLYDESQLTEIYKGLEIFPLDQVMIYADANYDWGQMREIRTGLETLPVEDVMSYTRVGRGRQAMGEMRIKLQHDYFQKIITDDIMFYSPFQIEAILKAAKILPLDQVQVLADPNYNTSTIIEMTDELEAKFLTLMMQKHGIETEKVKVKSK